MSELETDAQQGVAEAEPVATPAPITSDTGTDTTETPAEATAEPEAKPDEEPKRTPWFQKRIDDLTREKYEARRQADALAAQLEAWQRAQVQPEQDDGKPRQITQADIDRMVDQKAEAKAAQAAFDAECNAAYEKGKQSFPDFETALGNFRLLGGLPPQLVDAAIATGEAHKVLYELGKDPDEATRIMSLSPTRMAVELAKKAVSAPAPKPVSKAPAPVRPIDGNARVSDSPEHMTMDQFIAWREKNSK